MSSRSVAVPDELLGERADVVLAELLNISRSQAAALIADGRVTIDSQPVMKSMRIESPVWLKVDIPHVDDEPEVAAALQAPDVELPVIYADDDIVIIDKPAGVAAHPSVGWAGPTVSQSLKAMGLQLPTVGVEEREGIVHRLDVGTSGVMAVTLNGRAYSHLKQQFRDRTVAKTYHTVVQGHPHPTSGTIDAPIGRHPGADYKFAVRSDGRQAITHYDTIEAFRFATLLSVELETGRTHQIRVHMQATKHACVGDPTYGGDPVLASRLRLTRQWLHAVELGFEHPDTGQQVSFSSTYPDDLQHALDMLEEWTH
jgi:23S rRNA pseudouridine1911/1915/1917 synthase